MFQCKVFVVKLVSIDRLATSAVMICKITALLNKHLTFLCQERKITSRDYRGKKVNFFVKCKLKKTNLAHKLWNDSMKAGSSESKSFLAGAQCTEVFGGFWNNIGSKFHDDTTGWLTSNGHVKITFWKCHFE